MVKGFTSKGRRRRSGNLPAATTSFIGRRRELTALAGLLSDGRFVTVTGVGGIGKSRLALEAAADRSVDFRDGAWLISLSALTNADLLPHTVAGALGLTDQTPRPQLDVLAEYLADRELLLVLDTCEHLVDACAHLAQRLLRAAPGLKILATSRQPLCAEGEKVLLVGPLPVSGPALTLFTERARAAVPDVVLSASDRVAVEAVCAKLDGIPLAIELAAARLRTSTVQELLARLEDRFSVLTDGGGDGGGGGGGGAGGGGSDGVGGGVGVGGVGAADESDVAGGLSRHRQLLTTIGWSHELCTGAERLAWARLSVFAGGFDLAAARAVCADWRLPVETVHDVLTALVDKSILDYDASGGIGAGRYRMLDTVREYGHRWLTEIGESDAVDSSYLEHFLRMAHNGEQAWFGPRQPLWFSRMTLEHRNIRAALEVGLREGGDATTALELAGVLWFFWVGCGHLAEGRHYLERALVLGGEDARATATALWVTGYIMVLQGDIDRAVTILDACRVQAELEGDTRASAYAVHRLGCAALVSDDLPQAATLFTEALLRYDLLGELNSNVVMAQIELAMTAAFGGELAVAVALCEQARDTCRKNGERWAMAYALYVLSYAAWTRGQKESATELARECLRINRAFCDTVGTVLPLELLALYATDDGAHERAAILQGAARDIWRTVGMPLFGSHHFNAPRVECESRARKALGTAAYETAFNLGSGLDLDETIAYALDLHRPRPANSRRPAPDERRVGPAREASGPELALES